MYIAKVVFVMPLKILKHIYLYVDDICHCLCFQALFGTNESILQSFHLDMENTQAKSIWTKLWWNGFWMALHQNFQTFTSAFKDDCHY